MVDPADLQELESLGEETPTASPSPRKSSSAIFTLQGVLCVLILAALVGVKLLAPPVFEQLTQWYRRESLRTVPLPEWLPTPSSPGSPAPDPTQSPAPAPAPTPDLGALRQI